MICASCKADGHAPYDPQRGTGCRGGTWCACQHRTDRRPGVLLGVAAALGVPSEVATMEGSSHYSSWLPDPAAEAAAAAKLERMRTEGTGGWCAPSPTPPPDYLVALPEVLPGEDWP